MIPAVSADPRELSLRSYKFRSALLFCAPMMVNAIGIPYFPVWLNTLRFSDSEIGVILAVPMVLRVICAPLITMLADRKGERAMLLVGSGVLSLMMTLSLFATHSFWPVLIVAGLQGAFYAPYLPLAESVVVSGVRRYGFDYGSVRLWGSIAFIATTLAVGHLIALWSASIVLPVMVFSFCVAIALAFVTPRLGGPERKLSSAARRGKGSLLRRPHLQLLMIGASIVQASHGMLYGFSSIYWGGVGFSGTEIGLLWSAGVTAEVLVFFLGGRIFRRFGPWTLIRFGCAVAVCRWLLFPMSLGFLFYLLLQCLHAFTFAFIHLGIQRRIVDTVMEDQEASAQGAYFFYNGAFLALSTFASGAIYKQFGGAGFYAMSGLAALGLGLVIVAFYLQPQRAAAGG